MAARESKNLNVDEVLELFHEVDSEYFDFATRESDSSDSEDDSEHDPEENTNDLGKDLEDSEDEYLGTEITSLPATTSNSNTETAASANQDNEDIHKFHCKCGCYQLFDEKDIEYNRMMAASMEKSELDLVVLGKLSTFFNKGKWTVSSKKKATERKRARSIFTHEGKIIIIELLPVVTLQWFVNSRQYFFYFQEKRYVVSFSYTLTV